LHRRQMGRLAFARCYRRLTWLTPRKNRRADLEGDLRDVIAAKLGGSGRNAERYLHVLDAPIEVQQAFDRGDVSLVQASRVSGLGPDVQERIATMIRDGEDPKKAITAYLPNRSKQKPAQMVLAELLDNIDRGRTDLQDRMEQIGRVTEGQLRRLVAYRNFLAELIQYAKEHAVDYGADMGSANSASDRRKALR